MANRLGCRRGSLCRAHALYGGLEENRLGAMRMERDHLRALQGYPCRRMPILDDCSRQPARIGTKVDLTCDTELLVEQLR